MWGVLHLHLLQLSPQSQSDLGFRDIDKPFLMGIESARLPSRHIYSWPADNLMTTMTIHTYMRMRFHVCPCVGRDLMRSCPLRVRVQWPPDALSVEWPRPETPLRLSVWRSGIHVDRFIVYIYIYIYVYADIPMWRYVEKVRYPSTSGGCTEHSRREKGRKKERKKPDYVLPVCAFC